MDMLQILGLIMAVMMLIFIGPRAFRAMRDSPKGNKDDWINAAVPLVGVIVFVWLLTKMV